MPPLGPIVDLREDPSTDLRIAGQIGAAAGSFFGIRAAEKRKQRRDQMLAGVLQQSKEGNWTREQTYEEMLKIKGAEQSEFVKAYTQEMVKSQFREREQFNLGGQGYTPEERWEYDQRTGQSKKIATGPTPARPPQAGKATVFQDQKTGEYRYGFVNPYTGEVITDLRHATEQDFQEAKIEGQRATTEKTRAGTENIQQDTILDGLKYELQQEEAKDKAAKNEEVVKNLQSLIKTRESMLGVRQAESKAKIALTEARTEQVGKPKQSFEGMRYRRSLLETSQKRWLAVLDNIESSPKDVAQAREKLDEIQKKLDELEMATSEMTAPASAKTGQYAIGQIVQKGGKNWKIVGFDTDGEPLVDEVK